MAENQRNETQGLIASFRAHLRRRIESGKASLPVLQDSAMQLLCLCSNEDVEIEDLQEHVSRDQALCAHVLSIANSAAYSPKVPILSIQVAITRLGLDTFRSIALTVSMKQSFAVEGWEGRLKELWTCAAVTAGFAKEISRRFVGGAQRASLFGLLQDVGKPIVLSMLHDIHKQEGLELVPVVAEELIEEFHAEVGAKVMDESNLPSWLQDVIRHHHDYENAEHRAEAMVAHLADKLCSWALGQDRSASDDMNPQVLAELGLTEEDMQVLKAESTNILEGAQAFA